MVFAAATALLLLCQDPDLAAVLAAEARRVEVVARVAPAVCSVMDLESAGGGSGVIIDPLGFVLTNYHVVGAPEQEPAEVPKDPNLLERLLQRRREILPEPPEPPPEAVAEWQGQNPDAGEADRRQFVEQWQQAWREEHHPRGARHYRPVKVGLPDGRLYRATVLGIDPGSDLAVLLLEPRADGMPWPFAELGDSDQLLVGETVFAMGNPFLLATDFSPTVTFGVVSGTHRYQEGQGNRMLVYPDCIQVDAPVNPGNSGGPLFNERGEVVGINGRISVGARGRVNVGVGFAIASNQVKNFLGDLMAGRHAEHGTLDLSAWYMTAPNEASRRRGVFVQQTFKDSVAALAGVRLGDEITRFNGVQVRTANQLATLVGVLPAGAWVTLAYRPQARSGQGYLDERTVTIRLARLDTGSSIDARADTERLASRANRRIATAALTRRVDAGVAAAASCTVTYLTPAGEPIRLQRRGNHLRLDIAGRTLVVDDTGAGWESRDGVATDLGEEGRARLLRELRCNPFLQGGPGRRRQLAGALLTGGVHVHGRPALRFELPGEGEMEVWYFLDGRPAGYAFRDPVRRQRLELHVRGSGGEHSGDDLLVVADGKPEQSWRLQGPDHADIPVDRFTRPER